MYRLREPFECHEDERLELGEKHPNQPTDSESNGHGSLVFVGKLLTLGFVRKGEPNRASKVCESAFPQFQTKPEDEPEKKPTR